MNKTIYFGFTAFLLTFSMAFETHFNYIHDLPEPTMKLLKLIDNPVFGVNMDYGNAIQFPEHPSVADTIDAYKDKLLYIHLKNSICIQGEHKPCALSEGEINHREYLKKLKAVGYKGPIAIEATRLGDREWFAKQDFDYYKAVTQKIQYENKTALWKKCCFYLLMRKTQFLDFEIYV